MNNIQWLSHFFLSNCNGDWEHGWGIRIDTLDNPGWSLKIDLKETRFEGKAFNEIFLERTENDWVACKIEGNIFKGAGGPENLDELIDVFRRWAKETV